jgi:hypothetical protein
MMIEDLKIILPIKGSVELHQEVEKTSRRSGKSGRIQISDQGINK